LKSKRSTSVQILLLIGLLTAVAVYRLLQNTGSNEETADLLTATEGLAASQDSQTGSEATLSLTDQPSITQDFDYFVLALSWSPDYCASDGINDSQQCSIGKKLGFVLHGLWPQNNQGYPSSCSSQKLPPSVKAQFPGLYPSDSLFTHEWEKHGTCSGLSPEQYLSLSRQIKESIAVPALYRSPQTPFRTTTQQLKSDFIDANPGYRENTLAVNCSGSGRFLKELYICFSKTGQSADCGTDVRKQALKTCQSSDFLVRNTR
jgi:ribonuclease T2